MSIKLLAHTQPPCNPDRRDFTAVLSDGALMSERIVVRLTAEAGTNLVVKEIKSGEKNREYRVYLDGDCVFRETAHRWKAITVAQWMRDGYRP